MVRSQFRGCVSTQMSVGKSLVWMRSLRVHAEVSEKTWLGENMLVWFLHSVSGSGWKGWLLC